jgi:hypothetical protein
MPTNGPLINLDRVLEAMYANLSNLGHNTEYTLEQLVGEERWLATSIDHRKQLGIQFKFLVVTQSLPVTWVGSKSDNSQLYELN